VFFWRYEINSARGRGCAVCERILHTIGWATAYGRSRERGCDWRWTSISLRVDGEVVGSRKAARSVGRVGGRVIGGISKEGEGGESTNENLRVTVGLA
jgi:hypothetical protein